MTNSNSFFQNLRRTSPANNTPNQTPSRLRHSDLTTLEPMVLLSAGLLDFEPWDTAAPDVSADSSQGATILGTDGGDRIEALASDDVVFSEGGDDRVYGKDGADSLFGGDGDDEIFGGAGDDYIDGESGNDLIYAESGNDVMIVASGQDVIDGGSGVDLVELYDATDTVHVDLTTGSVSGGLTAQLRGVEGLLGSDQSEVFQFAAPAAGDVFYIHGSEGHDVLDLRSLSGGNFVQQGGHIQASVAGGVVDIYFAGVEEIVDAQGMRSAGVVDFWSLPDEYRQMFAGFAEDAGPAPTDVSPTLVGGVQALDNYDPAAEDDFASVVEDQSIVIDVLANDSDFDNDPLHVSSIAVPPGQGTVAVNLDGMIVYTPHRDFSGRDQFTYEVSDGKGGSDTAVVTIDVLPVNDAPEAVDDAFRTDADASMVVVGSVLLNDADPDGDPLQVTTVNGDPQKVDVLDGLRIFDLAGGGRVNVYFDGNVMFDPAGDFDHLPVGQTQDVSFDYEVSDGRGGRSTATATVTVVGTNQAPTTVGEHWWVEYNDAGRLGGLLYNDHDPDGDPLVIASVNGDAGKVDPGDGSRMFDLPQGGRLQVTTDGQVTFDPAGDFHHLHAEQRQDVTFTYEVSDGRGGTATETAMISVVGKNLAPTTVGEHWWVEYNDAGRLGGLLYNDHDPDGDALVIASVNGDAGKVDPGDGSRMFDLPQGGRLQVTTDGQVTFDPAGDFNHLHAEQRQDVTFTYEVSDGRGGTATETAMISVVGKNLAPTAVADGFEVSADSEYSAIGNLLLNDSDPDGDPLRVVSVNGDAGRVDVLDGLRIFDLAGGGRVNVYFDGNVMFDPAGDFDHLPVGQTQDVSFDYEVSDGRGGRSTATATVTVAGTNQAPTTVGEHWWVEYNDAGRLGGLLYNDHDPDGDALVIASVNGDAGKVDPGDGSRTFDLPQGGRLQVTTDGQVTFDPVGDFHHLHAEQRQDVTFTYEVSDGRGGTATETAMISVVGKNLAPTAVADGFEVSADSEYSAIGNLLLNDADPDGDPLRVVSVNGDAGRVDVLDGLRIFDLAGGGRVNVYFDGNVMFDPAGDFDHLPVGQTQDVSFDYEVSDGRGGRSTATATVTVVGTNQAPTAVNDLFYARSDQGFLSLGRLLANDSDADGDALTVTTVNGDPGKVDRLQGARTFDLDGGGRVNVYFDGNVMFDPAGDFDHLPPGQTQDVSFDYEVSDGRGGRSTATATVTVVGTNQAPTAVNDLFYARSDQGFLSLGRLLANDSDADGDALTVTTVNGDPGKVDRLQGARTFDLDGGGRVNVYFDGNVIFDPAGDFSHLSSGQTQHVSFRYQVSDGRGGVSEATATIAVTGVNDGPRAQDDHFYATADQGFLSVGRLLANDHDPDGDRLTVTRVDGDAGRVDNLQGMRVYDLAGGGRVNVYFDGNVLFDPAGDFNHLLQGQTQDVQFTYEISDGRGGTSTATATVTVSGTRVQQAAAAPAPAPAAPRTTNAGPSNASAPATSFGFFQPSGLFGQSGSSAVPQSGYAAGAASATGDSSQTSTTSHVDEYGRESASGYASSSSDGSGGATSASSAQSGRASDGSGLNGHSGGDSNSYSETSETDQTAECSGRNSTATATRSYRYSSCP